MKQKRDLAKYIAIEGVIRRFRVMSSETINGITEKKGKNYCYQKDDTGVISQNNWKKMDKKGLIEWSKNGNPRIKKYANKHKIVRI